MKKQNYYSIHKNKKKRKSTITKQMNALKIVKRVIRSAIILAQKCIEISNGIYRNTPKYSSPNYGNYKKITDKIIKNKIFDDTLIKYHDYASRSGSNIENVLFSMDFCDGIDNAVESVIDSNGVIHVLKPREQFYKSEEKVNVSIPEEGHVFSKHWFDEAGPIDPNQYDKLSKRNDNYRIYGCGPIQVPTDFSQQYFMKLVNEGKLKLTNPFIENDIIEEIKNYKPEKNKPKPNNGEWH